MRVKLYSRACNDLTYRFPLIVEALSGLRPQSCIIDGEAVACGEDGIANFERIRYRHKDDSVFLYAFDLIELDGEDLRAVPLTGRKRRASFEADDHVVPGGALEGGRDSLAPPTPRHADQDGDLDSARAVPGDKTIMLLERAAQSRAAGI
jgi:ATP-dependent DNA ligase